MDVENVRDRSVIQAASDLVLDFLINPLLSVQEVLPMR